MAYHIRCLCTSGQVPTPAELLSWLEERDVQVKVQGDLPEQKMRLRDWHRLPLLYKSGRLPIVVECQHVNATGDQSARKFIDERLQEIGGPGRSSVKRRIATHLQNTTLIIDLDVPRDDMDDQGWDANGQLLTFFCENNSALIHAQGEGFYERSELILPDKK